jgi:hypothetical protein
VIAHKATAAAIDLSWMQVLVVLDGIGLDANLSAVLVDKRNAKNAVLDHLVENHLAVSVFFSSCQRRQGEAERHDLRRRNGAPPFAGLAGVAPFNAAALALALRHPT